MRSGFCGAVLVLMCTAAWAGPQPVTTVRSSGLTKIQERFAPIVAAQGRKLVIFDADSLVRPFGDAVLGRTWDALPKNARGSFERISAATGERRAFSILVRVGGKVECRVGPTSPDQAWINLLSAYAGQDRTQFDPKRLTLTPAVFQQFILAHEIGHCADKHAFDRDRNPLRNAMLRHRAEGFGDVFAILQLARGGTSKRALQEIVWIRALYLSSSATAEQEERKDGGYPPDETVAGYEHVPYFNIDAMNAAVSISDRVGSLDDRQLVDLAHRLIEMDGVSIGDLIAAHRALAKQPGFTHAVAEVAVADARRALLSPGVVVQGPADFDRQAWEREFDAKLKLAGSAQDGAEAAIAAERTRLRALAGRSVNVDDATAIEAALGRLAELATKGYAIVTDPPVTVTSRSGAPRPLPVAAMASRTQVVGPVPADSLHGALKALTADRVPPVEVKKKERMAARGETVPFVRTGKVNSSPLVPPKPVGLDEMTGISSSLASIKSDNAAQPRR
ncbi:hypothetical protein ACVIGB_000586 [Bradyrhizobium sp. USDA 4341]